MKDKKLPFFTKEFYENPKVTLNVFNQLVKENQVADKDMYQNGAFLFMEVYENEKTVEILKPIISDLQAYKIYNNQKFASDESTQIGLCALQEEHTKYFGSEYEIKWNHNSGKFVLSSQKATGIKDYGKIENQIGCGYCQHEKMCTERDPKINKARQGCDRFKHYKNK